VCVAGFRAPARRGDGLVSTSTTTPEPCDDGDDHRNVRPFACRTDCRKYRCGDRVLDASSLTPEGSTAVAVLGEEECDGAQSASPTAGAACSTACTKRLCGDGVVQPDDDGQALPGQPVYGACGRAGRAPGFLDRPTHVAVSPATGALYSADTGNDRVLRVAAASMDHGDGGPNVAVALGDGSDSNAGEGAPGRASRCEARGSSRSTPTALYVAADDVVCVIVGADGSGDGDGKDRVTNAYAASTCDGDIDCEPTSSPEAYARCRQGLAVLSDGSVVVADACQGSALRLSVAPAP